MPSGAETLLSGPWVLCTMSQRRALHPGTIREEDTWCWNNRAWEGPQWGLRDPHCGSLHKRTGQGQEQEGRRVGGAPTSAETPEPRRQVVTSV